MIKILALDTSTDACSAALLSGEEVSDRFMIAKQQHTKFILPMIHELLAQAQLNLNQLDAIAFGCGPGSFTGVRLAASITQGLAIAANLPVLKISTLRTLAQEVLMESKHTKVLVAQDARMQELYWGEYEADASGIMHARTPDKLIAPQNIKIKSNQDLIGIGDGWKVYEEILTKQCKIQIIATNIHPRAKYLAQLALADFKKNLAVVASEALPTYLREEVAWVK
jgi:tRNA threonylcarbamoyladenosine biosynthesis protein TsaB